MECVQLAAAFRRLARIGRGACAQWRVPAFRSARKGSMPHNCLSSWPSANGPVSRVSCY